jgi:hypothetical protein
MGLFGKKRPAVLDYTSAVNPAPNPMRDPMASLGGYDRNAAMQGQSGFAPMNQGFAPPEQKKPGFFSKGGAWLDVLGAFGDGFGTNGPVYAQSKMQKNRLMQEQQMAEQKRQQDRENFLFEESYKRANPMPRNDELANLMRNAGIDPEGPEAKSMYSAALTNKIYHERMVPFTDEQGNSGLMSVRSGMPQQQGAPIAPTSQAEYQALPAGAQYRAPDGSIRTKGGSVGNGAGGFR